MDRAMKGTWVEIENEVLSVGDRAPQVPNDTRSTPLIMWTRGFLIEESALVGDIVSVITLSDRVAKGKLVDADPSFKHDFGKPVPELLKTGVNVKKEIID